jgi:hypothetical protein
MNDGPGSLLSDANKDKAAVVGTYGGASGEDEANEAAVAAAKADLGMLKVVGPVVAAAIPEGFG